MMAGWQGGLRGQLFLVWASPAAACSSWSLRKNRPGQGRAAAAQPLNTPRFCSRPLAWTVTLAQAEIEAFPRSSACETKQALGVSGGLAKDRVLRPLEQLGWGRRQDSPSGRDRLSVAQTSLRPRCGDTTSISQGCRAERANARN